jgi:sporulation protein YlmC with PRC-barrel domain
MNKLAAAALTALLLAGPTAARAADQPASGMPAGGASQAQRQPTVSEAPGQIRAKDAIGLRVIGAAGHEIGTVRDLVIDRGRGLVDLAVLDVGGRDKPVTIAWNSLQFDARPTPHFVTRLSGSQVASGQTFEEAARKRADFIDVKDELLGKQAYGPEGNRVGTIEDLVLAFGSGRPAALLVDTSGGIEIAHQMHAVPWQAARPEITKDKPVKIALDEEAINRQPVTTTKAPESAGTSGSANVPAPPAGQSGNSTLGNSGEPAPAPAVRR